MEISGTHDIPAPRPPGPPSAFRFPVIGSVAPVVAAVAFWAITGSAFALVFAALGPITAVAGFVDSRLGARRSGRRERARFEREVEATRLAIAAAHESERAERREIAPLARDILARPGSDPYRWRADLQHSVACAVGQGEVASRTRLVRVPGASGEVDSWTSVIDALERSASVLDAVVGFDVRLGVGVSGEPPLATAIARALAVQTAWALSPARYWCSAPDGESVWTAQLPHRAAGRSMPGWTFRFGERGSVREAIVIAVAASSSALPGACSIVLRVTADGDVAVVQHPDRSQRRQLRPDSVSLDEAVEWAAAMRRAAHREGVVESETDVPATIQLSRIVGTPPESGLGCTFAVGSSAAVRIDLVEHGPHAVVGGTTGSGKSELLVCWVLAMAAVHAPAAVNFLLVDFKGGSAFRPLAGLPHTVGIVTDLNEEQAARALASLRAELRHRERTLAEAGARDIDSVPALPRLVIVVDEFAALLAENSGLHALFSDIAARGRSLGVHLVLCTQRPAGVVRDSVLANADLRVSLRVNNAADSVAVIGADAASAIPAQARGRGILRLAGQEPELVQFALATPSDVADIADRWSGSPPPRRPWCEPLPPLVAHHYLPRSGSAIPFGLIDVPDEQRIGTATWDPVPDGHLLILGAAGCGKSTALETIAAADAWSIWMPRPVDAAWDLVARLDNPATAARIVLIDDFDSLLVRLAGEYRAAFLDRVTKLLRDGPARGIRLVISAQRMVAEAAGLVSLLPSRLMLRHSSRQDHVLAGGDGARYVAELPPGGGLWRSRRVQVAAGAAARPPDALSISDPLDETRPLALVSSRAGALAEALAARSPGSVLELATLRDDPVAAVMAAGRRVVLLGDVEAWQSRWGALASLQSLAEIVFDGCATADFKALTRSRELPPPISTHAGGQRSGWLLKPDGSASRVLLPF